MHETTSFVDESVVVGRESDKDSIVQMMLSKNEKKGIQVISVVGKGGLGKTTFAQLIYNDPSVDKHFDLKAWVFVPKLFDASRIAQAILELFDKSFDKSKVYSLENLRQRIKSLVLERNFLLVLDNVWTVDSQEWGLLRNILVGLPGCRILVTTRDVKAAETMETTHLLDLKDLSDNACATILNTIALDGRSEADHEQLEGIGSEIAKKCNGLPLAAKTIARMLKPRNTVQEWEVVRNSPMWRYKDEMGDTYNALRLSYADLSPIHKRCFLSCALYPKGTKFNVAELIRLWMAQGYISSSATCEEVQEQGMRFFQVLVNRSFFQEVEREGGEGDITCKMHDVMHDLAIDLASSEYYFVEGSRTWNTPLYSAGRIQCFCAKSDWEYDFPPHFISYLKCVRVLCLGKCRFFELPEETLDLRDTFLTKLPRGIGRLQKLKHLLISNSWLSEYPRGLRKLKGLWMLDEFYATNDSIGHLENLNELRGRLKIVVKDENIEASGAEKANLKSKRQLKSLVLLFSDVKMDVINALVPPSGLSSLYVEGGGNSLPRWITTIRPITNLKRLTISFFDDTSYNLPPLEKLPMLETLSLLYMSFKRVSVMEFLGRGGGFSKLKSLKFSNCLSWEEWEDLRKEDDGGSVVCGMPCLEELELSGCPELKALPYKLLRAASRLRKLAIEYCDCLESRYYQEFGDDRDEISHIPCISISRDYKS